VAVERKIIAIKDLKAVSLDCVNCRARVTIERFHDDGPDEGVPIPKECPDCHASWLPGAQDNQNFLFAISRIRFSIPPVRMLLEFDEAQPAVPIGEPVSGS
jgi:hypothetical protein